jgi:hypothetical protein
MGHEIIFISLAGGVSICSLCKRMGHETHMACLHSIHIITSTQVMRKWLSASVVWSKWLLYCTYSCIAGWVVKFFQWPTMGFEFFYRFSGWAIDLFLENLFSPPAHRSSYFMTDPLNMHDENISFIYVQNQFLTLYVQQI